MSIFISITTYAKINEINLVVDLVKRFTSGNEVTSMLCLYGRWCGMDRCGLCQANSNPSFVTSSPGELEDAFDFLGAPVAAL